MSDQTQELDVWRTSGISEPQINRILAHYHSPYVGQASIILRVAQSNGINPIFLLAAMKVSSSLGNNAGSSTLHVENIANPVAVHFSPHSSGVQKLRLPNGQLPTVEQSLVAFARDFKQRAGGSQRPVTTYAAASGQGQNWRLEVLSSMAHLSRLVH